MATLLIVDDEVVLARNLAKAFSGPGFDVHLAASVAEALDRASQHPPDVVLLDLRLPDGSGLDVLDHLLTSDPGMAVIMMTAHGSITDAVHAMQRGARDYVPKPLDLSEIRLKVERALQGSRQGRELAYYRGRVAAAPGGAEIVGKSTAVERLRGLAARVTRVIGGPGTPAPTVLLLGETGSGKGHIARAIRSAGGRRDGSFVEVNCTALPENLVEAELFGHERGAFTDAKTSRPGLFETADGGTIFLDEIGHVSATLQSKFLKVIEEKTVRRIGATSERRVDVHIIAASSRDLEAAVRLGEFREDLYQRLSVAVIHMPPVRERERDAVLLARTFLADAGRRYGMSPRTLSPEAEQAVLRYPWPGNVREIANTMERVVLFTDSEPVRAEDLGLPSVSPQAAGVGVTASGELRIDFPESGLSLEAVERALLVAAIERASGNQSAAARLLGISRDTLRYRMEKYNLGE